MPDGSTQPSRAGCPVRSHPYGSALLVLSAAASVVLAVGLGRYRVYPSGPYQIAVVLVAVAAAAAAQRYPVQVHARGRLLFTNVPLFVMAVLLPPPLAAVGAFVAMGGGWWCTAAREWRSNLYAVMFGARWCLFVALGSAIAHAGGQALVERSLVLAGAAGAMWLADTLTIPLVISQVAGESPLDIILDEIRVAGPMEIGQYLMGILGAAAASAYPWSPVLLAVPVSILYLNSKRTKELQESTGRLLVNLADAVDLRDPTTGGHSRRVTEHVRAILSALAIVGPEMEMIVSAARVHDIGKIGIPDSVLNKAGKLTAEERAVMEGHAATGADFLARHQDFERGTEIVRHHHEAWDGTGYPGGLRGHDIPFGARVLAVADSYDAMTSDRPYRAAMSHEVAVSILREGRGVQWDPVIVDVFLSVLEVPAAVSPVPVAAEPAAITLAAGGAAAA